MGDHVAFETSDIPLPHVEAVVINIENGVLGVMSTLLVPFQHDGIFSKDKVNHIKVVRRAAEAIPLESRGKNFVQHQKVIAVVKRSCVEGEVVAAFDGLVVARQRNGQLIAGGASYFHAA